jgi:hypothetical protein
MSPEEIWEWKVLLGMWAVSWGIFYLVYLVFQALCHD